MIPRYFALVIVAIAQSGCCLSGSGCSTTASGASIAWDGLGSIPAQNLGSEHKPTRTRHRHQIILGPLKATTEQPQDTTVSKDRWEQEQTAEQNADATLTRQLKICRGC